MSAALLVARLLLAQVCPPGQSTSPDTAGHCCWANQAWSNLQSRCVGVPTCGGGLRAEGEQCVTDCPEGQSVTEDTAGHCCWPQQAWSNSRAVCVGLPACPSGMSLQADGCVTTVSLPAPRYEPPPPAPEPEPVPPPARVPARAPIRAAVAEEPTGGQVQAAPEAPRDDYAKYGAFDLRFLGVFDPGAPAMLGGQLDFALTFVRGHRGRFGLCLGVGYLGSPESGATARGVFIAPATLFAGIHLGRGIAELVFRAGGALAVVNQFSTSATLAKLLVGSELLLAFSRRGSGFTFGFDLYFLSGASLVFKLGFVW